ncbi:Fic family protein [Pseudomonas putida]
MSDAPFWIWQQPEWPHFHWCPDAFAPLLRECVQAQGQLSGMTNSTDAQSELDVLLQNILTSSAIEGEQLNVGSVRSSLARRLGLAAEQAVTARSEGLAELMIDVTRDYSQPLSLARLYHWHRLLFPNEQGLLAPAIQVATLRGDEPMQVVSGRLDRPTVHFEAPPRTGLEGQVQDFIEWFNADEQGLDPLVRAGVAHFWFITLHPFEDGNGRLTRALTDLALAQGEHQAIRFYAMSASILEDRRGYYEILEACQKGELDITAWLQWFLRTLLDSINLAMASIERVLGKARFWQRHRHDALSPEQLKVLNRLLDGGERGFSHGINASQYQAVAKVSKATATRHLADLLEKGCLYRLPGAGRSTRYQINFTGDAPPPPSSSHD